jgi:hypothetical protein
MRRLWPLLVGVTLVFMVGAYLVGQAYVSPAWAALFAMVLGVIFVLGLLQLPQTTRAWRLGAEGERRTAQHLQGLAQSGFVVLNDRKVPGYGGNLDHIAVGPSGVWAIETKRLKGKVEIQGDELWIGGRRQDRIVDQVYREAVAVQIALRDHLDPLAMTVNPILCLHASDLPWFNKSVRRVRLASGRGLVRTLASGDAKLTAEQVQTIARSADERLVRATRA